MADVAKRVDHFASLRESSVDTSRKVDPTLEYEKYRITPGLIRHLKDLKLTVRSDYDPRYQGLDDLIKINADMAYRAGQADMIRMLESLMATQEDQV